MSKTERRATATQEAIRKAEVYEAWRIAFQDSELAARTAFALMKNEQAEKFRWQRVATQTITDISKAIELMGYSEDRSGESITSLVEEYIKNQQPNIPNEQGTNRYGLDMAYFRNVINRELNRPLVDYRPHELARIFARLSRTADSDVMFEPEFQPQQPVQASDRELEAANMEGYNEACRVISDGLTQLMNALGIDPDTWGDDAAEATAP